jgi:hypothetical protein
MGIRILLLTSESIDETSFCRNRISDLTVPVSLKGRLEVPEIHFSRSMLHDIFLILFLRQYESRFQKYERRFQKYERRFQSAETSKILQVSPRRPRFGNRHSQDHLTHRLSRSLKQKLLIANRTRWPTRTSI